MPTYINSLQDGDDSVKILQTDSIVVGMCSRDDYPVLSKMTEVQKAGVYILMDGNRRYVGQATSGVNGRLSSHNKNKDWWSELVFISHAYGALSPDKLNYLESKLIKDFGNLGYEMDNGNGGNQNSYIATPQMLEAERFLQLALDCLRHVGNVELYSKPSRRKQYSSTPLSLQPPTVVPVSPSVPLISATSAVAQSLTATATDDFRSSVRGWRRDSTKNNTKEQRAVDWVQYKAPYTLEDSQGRKITSELFIGNQDGIFTRWFIELSKDSKIAEVLLKHFTLKWRIQPVDGDHKLKFPDQYVEGYNGVFVHFHSIANPLTASKDIDKVSKHLGIDVKILDSNGVDLFSQIVSN